MKPAILGCIIEHFTMNKPVISENISTFTVVLEFIEIALPAQSAVDKV